MATNNNNNEGIENNIIDQAAANKPLKTSVNLQKSEQDPDGKIDAEGMLITGEEEESIEDYQDDLSVNDEKSEESDLFAALAFDEINLNPHTLPDSLHYGFDSDQILTSDDPSGLSTDNQRVQQFSSSNEAPIITTDTATASENQTTVAPNVAATDPEGNPVIFSLNLDAGDDSNQFTIDAVTGALTFKRAPDFEAPTDVGDGDGVYQITVIATDSLGNASEKTIAVTVTDVNEAPTIVTETVTAAENQTSVMPNVAATDPEGNSVTFSLNLDAGDDSNQFTIDKDSGALMFKRAPDFEAPTDIGDGDGVYQITVIATDSLGNASEKTIAVTVTDVNEAPTIATETVTASENQTTVAPNVAATDPEDNPITFSLNLDAGDDSSQFTIDKNSGALTFKRAPDFEAPTDVGDGNGVYQVTVVATDSLGAASEKTITVTVTDVNEAPDILTTAVTAAENQTSVMPNVAVTDPEGNPVTFSLNLDAGDDSNQFTIDAVTGALTFKRAPDFEAPTDVGDGDGVYQITVIATDSLGNASEKTIAVTVTDVNEAPTIVTETATAAENQTTVTANVAATDPEGNSVTFSLNLDAGDDSNQFIIDKDSGALTFKSAPNFENPDDVGAVSDGIYHVTVVATDSLGAASEKTIAVTVTDVNEAPTIVTETVTASENQTTVAPNVAATDPEDNPITFSLNLDAGDDSSQFTIDKNSGALTFKSAPDFENPDDVGAVSDGIYHVTVVATDSLGAASEKTIAVTVTDVNEAPDIETTAATAAENQTTVVPNVAATDPEGNSITFSLKADAVDDTSKFTIDKDTGTLTFKDAPDFENPDDVGVVSDGIYDVTVVATDSFGNASEKTIAVTVTDVNEAPTLTYQFSALELSDLTDFNGDLGLILPGIDARDLSGSAVSGIGDINGDGFDDILIGAEEADPAGNRSGESYVVFGGAALGPIVNLQALNGLNGFTINGRNRTDFTGFDVSDAGDVNGDTIPDLLVSARLADAGGRQFAGETYLIYGANNYAPVINVGALNGTNGTLFRGIDQFDQAGRSISSAGDVNGDGIADIIIAANAGDPNGINNAGESYVIFGQAGGFGSIFELSSVNGVNGFTINGAADSDGAGDSVSNIGDINGDGFDDLIIGADDADTANGVDTGAAYVVFGSGGVGGVFADVELGALNGTNGFVMSGLNLDDQMGFSVSGIGDINGDGINDFAIGAPTADPGGRIDAGQIYVIFGGGSYGASFDLLTLNGSNGFIINGITGGDQAGDTVRGAGDVNGDGINDLFINARYADPNGQEDAGASYVVFGTADGFASTLNLADLNNTNGFVINNIDPFDQTGFGTQTGGSINGAGDVNGDGVDDLIIGAEGADQSGKLSAGETYVVFGSNNIRVSVEEGNFDVVMLDATDPDLADVLTFSVSGGVDGRLFDIDPSSGLLSFDMATPPDFEDPDDADQNNIYSVEITVTDGALSDVRTVEVVVTNAIGAMPIALDLNNNGFTFSRLSEKTVLFDADADGELENIAWIADPQDGWLVYDKNSDGIVQNIDEISFTQYVDGAKTDLEGLRAFDSNSDNLLNSHDNQYDLFKVWIDSNANGISEEGELVGLSQLDIVSIDLQSDNELTTDGDVTIYGQGEFLYSDGSYGQYADTALEFIEYESMTEQDNFFILYDNIAEGVDESMHDNDLLTGAYEEIMLDSAEDELTINLDESDDLTSYTESGGSYHDEGGSDMVFSIDSLSHVLGSQPVMAMEVVEDNTVVS